MANLAMDRVSPDDRLLYHGFMSASCLFNDGRKDMFYLMTHSTHFSYGYAGFVRVLKFLENT